MEQNDPFWANQNLMTPIFFLMDVVWFSQGAFEEFDTNWKSHLKYYLNFTPWS